MCEDKPVYKSARGSIWFMWSTIKDDYCYIVFKGYYIVGEFNTLAEARKEIKR